MKSALVVAGDPSGDLHGAALVAALKAAEPDLRVSAVGGPRLARAAHDFIEDLASRGMTGFWEPLRGLPTLPRLEKRLGKLLRERRPDAVICVDYWGFNRRVLRLAKAAGVPAYYFISPQVWATRAGRLNVMRRLVRRMLVIFPFEAEIYRRAGVPCEFVGHPLLDQVPLPRLAPGASGHLRLGLLPGSRPSEVTRHLPVFLAAAALIRRDFPDCRVQVFAAEGLADAVYAAAERAGAALVREKDYAERSRLDLVLCSSGTATLENALLGLPMVVVYKLSWPTYALARALIRVRHIAMANILAGRALVPELIQHHATPKKIAAAALQLLSHPRRLTQLRRDLAALRAKLGSAGTAERAAAAILGDLQRLK